MRLIVTRPEPDGERTAAILRGRGHEVLLAPMLRVEPLSNVVFGHGPWAAVLITSANAIRAVAALPRFKELAKLPIFVVGEHSAAAARKAGFADVHSAHGDAGDLVRFVRGWIGRTHDPLLYLSGEDRARDVAAELERAGFAVEVAVVYRAVAARAFSGAIAAALSTGSVGGVMHYSRRSAEAYLACAETGGLLAAALTPVHFCLSAQVAEPLAQAKDVQIAPQPQEESLLGLVQSD